MKRATLALILIMMFFISAASGPTLIEVARANPTFPGAEIDIQSPRNNVTYLTDSIVLDFDVSESLPVIVRCLGTPSIQCCLDGGLYQQINLTDLTNLYVMQRTDGPLYLNKNFTVRLSGLTAGEHSVFVTQTGSYDLVTLIYPQNVSSAVVYFSVALSPPRILPTSPQNQSYEVADVPLEFTAETDYGAVSWMGFSLDGQDNVTIAGNTTLTGLPNGYHSAVVYTNDTFGKMGKSETINFTINGETESEQFPIAPIAITAAGASTAGVATGIVIHFKKRRRQTRRL